MKNSLKLAAGALAVAGAFAASSAHAAGFMLTEQTAGSMGRAYAGVGVDGTDVGGMYYNPASMTLHPGTQIQMGFVGIGLNLDFAGDESKGIHDANGRFHPQAIPHGYISHQINDSTWVGLAMTVPFGMGTAYDSDWSVNERGIKATILTVDINPNFAWKLTEKFSIGAGISLQYASADLKTRTGLDMEMGGQKLSLGDLKSEIDADSWAWGFNVGMMWSPLENLRFGLSYRSKIKHDAEGDLTISDPNVNLPPDSQIPVDFILGQMVGTHEGYATVTAPAWALFSAAWDVNDLLSLYASFRWTDWSSFDKLDITSNGSISIPSVGTKPIGSTITNKWRDTYLGALGADLRLTDWWTLRGGIAYESSPISNPEYRTAIIPDADRWWFAIGSSFKLTDNLKWDVSFAHLHGVHERNLYSAESGGEKVGKFRKLDAYLLGTQLQYRW